MNAGGMSAGGQAGEKEAGRARRCLCQSKTILITYVRSTGGYRRIPTCKRKLLFSFSNFFFDLLTALPVSESGASVAYTYVAARPVKP